MDNWFTIDEIDANTYIISEYRHWEETHCYLVNGNMRSLLIDTGLGISNIYEEVLKLTDEPITAVATHIHWDHIGGHKYFPVLCAHADELKWLNGKFPLSIEMIKEMVVDRCDLPESFCVDDYEFFQGMPTRVLTDYDIIDIGGREIEVLHTPGHSPVHHSLDIKPEILIRMREAFRNLKANGKLHHGKDAEEVREDLGLLKGCATLSNQFFCDVEETREEVF